MLIKNDIKKNVSCEIKYKPHDPLKAKIIFKRISHSQTFVISVRVVYEICFFFFLHFN